MDFSAAIRLWPSYAHNSGWEHIIMCLTADALIFRPLQFENGQMYERRLYLIAVLFKPGQSDVSNVITTTTYTVACGSCSDYILPW